MAIKADFSKPEFKNDSSPINESSLNAIAEVVDMCNQQGALETQVDNLLLELDALVANTNNYSVTHTYRFIPSESDELITLGEIIYTSNDTFGRNTEYYLVEFTVPNYNPDKCLVFLKGICNKYPSENYPDIISSNLGFLRPYSTTETITNDTKVKGCISEEGLFTMMCPKEYYGHADQPHELIVVTSNKGGE